MKLIFQSTDLIIFTETRGNPDGMLVCHLPFGPTAFFSMANVVMRHDIPNCGTMSEQYPHLIFDNLNSKLGHRFTTILKHLFPVPKPDSKRIITFSNSEDYISFRHHVYKTENDGEVELTEAGPRFELKRKKILIKERKLKQLWAFSILSKHNFALKLNTKREI